jgi:hypothetical protein
MFSDTLWDKPDKRFAINELMGSFFGGVDFKALLGFDFVLQLVPSSDLWLKPPTQSSPGFPEPSTPPNNNSHHISATYLFSHTFWLRSSLNLLGVAPHPSKPRTVERDKLPTNVTIFRHLSFSRAMKKTFLSDQA